MLKNKSGSIIFSGATASLRGSAETYLLSTGKGGIRNLAQSLSKEYGPKGIHVSHVIIDGIVESDWSKKNIKTTLIKPDDISETFYFLANQPKTAWTFELDIRPFDETWN